VTVLERKVIVCGRPDCENFTGEETMSLEENKALLRRYYQEFFNEANLAAGEALHSADFIFHEGSNPPIEQQEYMRRNAMFLRAFPDRIVTIDFQVAEGDKVVTRSTLRATHRGDLPGIPATGTIVTITATITDRIENGKIAEEWEDWDGLGMMQQLGVILPPGSKEK
jgi:steroid delta-isomerase-like uncharacterized protein